MIQRLRLLSGLVLFTYVTTHLLNHALGMFSLAAAESGRWWFTLVWRWPPASVLLYASLLGHVALALLALYQRRHLRLPAWELLRLALGLAIPLQLIAHIGGTRLVHELYGVDDTYARVMSSFWITNTPRGVSQLALLLVAWAHGWLGIWYWLRPKAGFPRWQAALRLLGVLLPILALIGYLDLGMQVRELAASQPDWLARAAPALPPGGSAEQERLVDAATALFVAAVVGTFAARWLRAAWQRLGGVVYVRYPRGQRVAITLGTTILEASRLARIPHAALCGGRGRCSTCRVRVGAGLPALPAPSTAEARVLARVGAPPNVRLACQVRPTADVDVFPLLPPGRGLGAAEPQAAEAGGAERELAILFADMRDFTRFAERRLPYDVVFLLNQWAETLGSAIEAAGGAPNQFTGDGIMALFGLQAAPDQACRAALQAALAMARALDQLNAVLAADLHEPLRIGIGIHAGAAILGEMGYGRARYLTAVGDVVNTASRLEALAKTNQAQLVVSDAVLLRAGLDLADFPAREVTVRGRAGALSVRVVPAVSALAPLLDGTAAG